MQVCQIWLSACHFCNLGVILSGCSILYHFYGADIQSLLGITSHWYWSQDVSRLLDAPPHLKSWGDCKISDSVQVRLAISKCTPRWLIWWLWYVCCVPLYWWHCIKCCYSAAEIFLFIILTLHRSEKALEWNIPYFYKCSIKPSLFGSLLISLVGKNPLFYTIDSVLNHRGEEISYKQDWMHYPGNLLP